MVDPTAGSAVGRPALLWLPVAAWAALIFVLSSQSEPPDPAGLSGAPGWSQGAHFGLYLVLGALLYRAFQGSGGGVRGPQASEARCGEEDRRSSGAGTGSGSGAHGAGTGRTVLQTCMLALAAGALYGATDEAHQYFVPMRQADLLDWMVDVAGVLAGALVALALARRRGKL